MNRSLILASVVSMAFGSHAVAQSPTYDNLLGKYVDEKYEDCVSKAQGYTESEKTRKDPLPYLYMSMCLFEMSKIPKYQEMDDYKKADRDALKWAEKYRRKDKDKEFFDKYGDYWGELNTMAQESGLNFYESGAKGMTKARHQFEAMTGYYPEDPGPWLMLALTEYQSNMQKEGDDSMKKYQAALAAAGDIASLPEDQKKLLMSALINYADYLNSKGDKAGAAKALDTGKDYFMDNAEFKGAYNSYH